MDHRISGSASSVTGSQKFASVRNSAMEKMEREIANAAQFQSQDGFSVDETKAIEQLEKAIKAVQGPQKSLEISVHKETHTIMIKVRNKDTGELIREVPKEKLLDVAASFMEMNGLIVDEKA